MPAPALTFDFAPGTSVDGPAPDGFRLLERRRVVGRGRTDLRRLGALVLRWRLQRGAGIAVQDAGGLPAREVVAAGQDAVLRVPVAGVGGLGLTIAAPVRVTAMVQGRERIGFAYGTLPGHPEVGEESFVVTWRSDDRVELVIRAISRTAMPYALALPVARSFQRRYVGRYLEALTAGSRDAPS